MAVQSIPCFTPPVSIRLRVNHNLRNQVWWDSVLTLVLCIGWRAMQNVLQNAPS